MARYITAGLLFLMASLPTAVIALENQGGSAQAPPLNETIPEYRLGFGDVLEVKCFNNPRFNETLTVRPDGRIAMERIGEIFITGMTPLQLDSLITARYSEFVQGPDVTVFVREFAGYQVYVLGQVNTPGGYPIQRDMTLLQALAAAGGTKDGAKLGSVMVLRRGKGREVEAHKVDLKKAVDRSEAGVDENDIYVRPLDIVYVPKTFIASTSTFMTQVYDGFLPPVDVYLRALYLDIIK